MKILNVLFALFFINYSFSQSIFKKTDLVDEFGDKIGEVQRNVTLGTFSNSATNNSPLKVESILNLTPNYTLDEYKKIMQNEMIKQNFSEKDIKIALKNIDKTYYQLQNYIGAISFEFYEYENLKANFMANKTGVLSIKTENGKKLSCQLFPNSIVNNTITIGAYKEMTKGLEGVENQIKYGFYDWAQTEIFNEILNSKGEIQIVISIDNSTYKFTLNQQ
jgi:hypothetical protein